MVFEADKGDSIYVAAQKAVELARTSRATGGEVELVFNDLRISVHPGSHPRDIVTIYDLKHQIRQLGASS